MTRHSSFVTFSTSLMQCQKAQNGAHYDVAMSVSVQRTKLIWIENGIHGGKVLFVWDCCCWWWLLFESFSRTLFFFFLVIIAWIDFGKDYLRNFLRFPFCDHWSLFRHLKVKCVCKNCVKISTFMRSSSVSNKYVIIPPCCVRRTETTYQMRTCSKYSFGRCHTFQSQSQSRSDLN